MKITRFAIDTKDISKTELELLLFIEESKEKDISTITYQTVKESLKISKRAFFYAMDSLHRRGLIDQV